MLAYRYLVQTDDGVAQNQSALVGRAVLLYIDH